MKTYLDCLPCMMNQALRTGRIATDNEEIFKRVKTMRLHGINRDIWDRFSSKVPSWEYDVVEAGYKYNMPDITAAIGLDRL